MANTRTMYSTATSIPGLNRDISKTQVITKDDVQHETDAGVKLDNAAIANPLGYAAKTAEALKNSPVIVGKTAANTGVAVGNLTNVVVSTATGQLSPLDAPGTYVAATDATQGEMDKHTNTAYKTMINKGITDKDADQTQAMLSEADKANGGSGKVALYDSAKIDADKQTGLNPKTNEPESKVTPGFIEEDTQNPQGRTVYINGNATTGTDLTDGAQIEGILIHEGAHREGMSEGAAKILQSAATAAWSNENFWSGDSTGIGSSNGATSTTQANWLKANQDSPVITGGTSGAAGVKELEALTVFVHGTWSSPEDADPKFIKAVSNSFGEKVEQLRWSGKNTDKARINAGEQLSELVENHQFQPGEKLNIVAHSHGGNVVNEFTQLYQPEENYGRKIDNIVYLGTPQKSDYRLDTTDLAEGARVLNVYDGRDLIQKLGEGSTGLGHQTMNDALNIKVAPDYSISSFPPVFYKSHVNLDSKTVWDQISPKLTVPKKP